MISLLKKMVIGTRAEPLARRVFAILFRKSGAENLSDIYEHNRAYDEQTSEVMKRVLKRGSNCVDVGCHVGAVLREIMSFSPQGAHFAFEPLPRLYAGLLKSFSEDSNVYISDYALSDSTGTSSFQHVVTNPAYSGFLKRRYDRPNEEIEQITVKKELLDNLIPNDVRIDFIKIDVEGAELEVLRGAVKIIKTWRPVMVFEHGLGAADYYGTSPESIYDLLNEACGLRLFIMLDWIESDGKNSLNRKEFCEQFNSGNNYYFMAAA